MNLLKMMMSTSSMLLTMCLLPQKMNKTHNNSSSMALMMILNQMMYMHTESKQSSKMYNMIFMGHTHINNLHLKMHQLTMDYLSTYLLLLTTMLIISSILMSKSTMYHSHKKLLFCLFATTTMLYLTFTTTHLLMFYILFESSMIPLMIMMGMWGSRKEKMRAIYYFLLYTMSGSIPLFVTILTMNNQMHTLNKLLISSTSLESKMQMLLFTGLFLAFAMKTPLMPWHTWLPLAHVEAPAMGSILLAGMLLKLGTYGFIRFTIPTLPHTSKFLSPLMITTSMMSLWTASLNSLRQNDIKRIIAYSSMAHMGMITAAIFTQNNMSKNGAMILMISHGLTSPTLFMLTSSLYERHKTRLMKNYQGSSHTSPILTTLTMMTSLAHMSTPGSMNFMGEYTCLLGLWEQHPSTSMLSMVGMLMTTAYLLLLYMQMASSKSHTHINYKSHDLKKNEFHSIMVLTIPNITLGTMPTPITTMNMA